MKDYFKQVTVAGYRSYGSTQVFEPVYPRTSRDGKELIGYNVIVGPNNSGKSSLVELLSNGRWAAPLYDDVSTEYDISIATTEGLAVRILTSPEGPPRIEPATTETHPQIRPLFISSENDISFSAQDAEPPEPGPIPRGAVPDNDRAKVMAFRALWSLSEKQSDFGGIDGLALLWALHEGGVADEFCEFMRTFVSDFGSFFIKRGRQGRSVVYKDQNGVQLDPNYLSRGTKTILVAAAYLFYFNHIGGQSHHTPEPSCMVFDEPERSLQPEVQRKLKRLLVELSAHMQIIVATHSPYFVDWLDLQRGGGVHRVYKTQQGYSEIKTVTYENVMDSNLYRRALASSKQARRMHHYDPLSREVLFANRCLLVEGQDDALILRRFIDDRKLNFSFEVFGYGADGASNIPGWVSLLQALGIKVAVLLDGNVEDVRAEVEPMLAKPELVDTLPTDDIRDKRAYSAKEVEGIASEQGDIKPGYTELTEELLARFDAELNT